GHCLRKKAHRPACLQSSSILARMDIRGIGGDTAVEIAAMRPIGESSGFKSAVQNRTWIGRGDDRTRTDGRVSVSIDASQSGKVNAGIGVSTGWILQDAA